MSELFYSALQPQTKSADIVERIRHACKQPSDKALAAFLGITPSVLSSWQHSKKPPYHGCYLASQKTGVAMEWFIDGYTQTVAPELTTELTTEKCCEAFKVVLNAAIGLGIVDSAEKSERLEDKLQMLGEGLYQNLMKSSNNKGKL